MRRKFLFIQSAIALATISSFGTTEDYNEIDWMEYDSLPKDIQSKTAPYCSGAFVDPSRFDDQVDLSIGYQHQPVVIRAQQLNYSPQSGYTASGDVEVRQNSLRLFAGEAAYNPLTGLGNVNGQSTFRAENLLVIGSDAQADFGQSEITIDNIRFVLHNTGYHGTATTMYKDGNDVIYLRHATLTRCAPDNPTWEVTAGKLKVNRATGIATTQNAVLKIRDVPVFYTPYFRFPIDGRRLTGLLSPTLEFSWSDFSLSELAVPLYINLAPNYDTTITSRYLAEYGWGWSDELRYLGRNNEGIFTGTWFANGSKADRWTYDWNNTTKLGDKTRLYLHYQDMSDANYRIDFENGSDEVDYLDQSARLTTDLSGWDTTFKVQHWAIVNDDLALKDYPYAVQPGISTRKSWGGAANQFGFGSGFAINRFSRNLTDAETNSVGLDSGIPVEGYRFNSQLNFNYPLEASYGFFKPELNVYHASYQLEQTGSAWDKTVSNTVPQLVLDSGLKFSRPVNLKFAQRQTLEPRAYYVYTPYISQYDAPLFDSETIDFTQSRLYSNRRFSGSDRIGDMNRLTVGAKTRFLQQDNQEWVSLSLDQLFYLEPEKLQEEVDSTNKDQKLSQLYFGANWQISPAWHFATEQVWDWDRNTRAWEAWHLRYRTQSAALINADYYNGYNETEEENEEIAHFSFIMPFAQRWGITTALNYDFYAEGLDESVVGIEYDSCCWNIRVLNKFAWEGNVKSSFLVEFELKGLGGYGNNIDSLLRSKVTGYTGRIYE
ncbi:LPS-assembly protein LptD [Gynuella sunshinyii]|nr:LPS assembly protein LptD [Gynuella sunshinyii]